MCPNKLLGTSNNTNKYAIWKLKAIMELKVNLPNICSIPTLIILSNITKFLMTVKMIKSQLGSIHIL